MGDFRIHQVVDSVFLEIALYEPSVYTIFEPQPYCTFTPVFLFFLLSHDIKMILILT